MEAVIFAGVQAAGKSSFYRERFFDTHVRVNLDMLRTRYRERLLVQACVDSAQPFVVDNTNPSIAERARYVLPARKANFRITCYYFRTPLADALCRNAARDPARRVPDKAIFGTQKRLQLPTHEEGFDLLFEVTLAAKGFVVVPLIS